MSEPEFANALEVVDSVGLRGNRRWAKLIGNVSREVRDQVEGDGEYEVVFQFDTTKPEKGQIVIYSGHSLRVDLPVEFTEGEKVDIEKLVKKVFADLEDDAEDAIRDAIAAHKANSTDTEGDAGGVAAD